MTLKEVILENIKYIIMNKILKFTIVLVLMTISASAYAQFGIEANYLYTNIYTRDKSDDNLTRDKFDGNGVRVGINYNFKIGKRFCIQPGVSYSYIKNNVRQMMEDGIIGGIDITPILDFTNMDVKWSEHYVSVPIYFKYREEFVKGFALMAYTGPTLQFGIGSRMDAYSRFEKFNASYDFFSGKSVIYTPAGSMSEELDPIYNRFDVNWGIGLGVELFRFLEIQVGYDFGLMNKLKDEDIKEELHQRRDIFYVGASLRF